jgi:hypothetical protein
MMSDSRQHCVRGGAAGGAVAAQHLANVVFDGAGGSSTTEPSAFDGQVESKNSTAAAVSDATYKASSFEPADHASNLVSMKVKTPR